MATEHTVTSHMVELAEIRIRRHHRLSSFGESSRKLALDYAAMLTSEYDLRKKENPKQRKDDLVKQLIAWWKLTCSDANRTAKPEQDRVSLPMSDLVVLAFRLAVNHAHLKEAEPRNYHHSTPSFWYNETPSFA